MSGEATRCGTVAVIGAPNAGKSTLINTLVGAKVSIVSPKVQTTRTRVLGIVMRGETQIILVDTPGLFRPDPKKKLERAMVAAAWDSLPHTDAIVLLVDSTSGNTGRTDMILERLREFPKIPCFLALNKIDAVRPPELLAKAQKLNEAFPFAATFMISGQTGDGVEDLLKALSEHLPQGPFLYPEDQISDMPVRLLAAEITREKLFLNLHEEIPYALTVETENWETFRDGSIKIDQVVYVQREAHKKIVLGKGGAMIKKVGELARREIEEVLEGRAHLKLFVKVRENWIEDPERLSMWGLDHKA